MVKGEVNIFIYKAGKMTLPLSVNLKFTLALSHAVELEVRS